MVSATSVSGGTETYEYDGNGRLCKITNCYDEMTDQIVYNENGSVNWLTNASGLKQVYTYDKVQKQTGLKEYDGDTLIKTLHMIMMKNMPSRQILLKLMVKHTT